MKRKALIVSSASPYPFVTSGCERLVVDFERHIFSGYDVSFLHTESSTWEPLGLFHDDELLARDITIERLRQQEFQFVLFIGFRENDFTRSLVDCFPSFCLTDVHPRDDLPDHLFKGIMTHLSASPHSDVLLLGASYNSAVFYKERRGEEFLLSVGRIHPDKNQLELVRDYRERIYRRYKVPLRLVGGVTDVSYFREVSEYIDNQSVFSTVDPHKPLDGANWRTPHQIAELCNRARIFVMASPKESFCIALVEALACGTTCVVNGDYWGFEEADLRPRVYGHIKGKRGSILDVLDEALSREIRIDAAEWVKKFSLSETKQSLLRFINARI